MFAPRDIVYGFANNINPPHPKYLVTIYRDENLHIMACMTTSKLRAGISENEIKHGPILRRGNVVSYVFEAGVSVGINPEGNSRFSFPLRTTIAFDYCWKVGTLEHFMQTIENPKVVAVMDWEEYINLVYALYKSPSTNRAFLPLLDKILQDYYTR